MGTQWGELALQLSLPPAVGSKGPPRTFFAEVVQSINSARTDLRRNMRVPFDVTETEHIREYMEKLADILGTLEQESVGGSGLAVSAAFDNLVQQANEAMDSISTYREIARIYYLAEGQRARATRPLDQVAPEIDVIAGRARSLKGELDNFLAAVVRFLDPIARGQS